jgi:FtsZ-binding cell division protein ZapB
MKTETDSFIKQIKDAKVSDEEKATLCCILAEGVPFSVEGNVASYLMGLIHLEWRNFEEIRKDDTELKKIHDICNGLRIEKDNLDETNADLSEENAELRERLADVERWSALYNKENAEWEARWEKRIGRIDKMEAIRFTEKDRISITNEKTFAMLSSTDWISKKALMHELKDGCDISESRHEQRKGPKSVNASESREREHSETLKPIIHFLEVDAKYLCNKAVTPTKGKCSSAFERVTCKNCLKNISHWNDTYIAKSDGDKK